MKINYDNIYRFVNGDLKKYREEIWKLDPNYNENTISSSFYRARDRFNKTEELLKKQNYSDEIGTRPNHIKILEAEDIKSYNINTKNTFEKNGFIPSEIDWLENNGYVKDSILKISNILLDNFKEKLNVIEEKVDLFIEVNRIDLVEKDIIEIKNYDDFRKIHQSFFDNTFIFKLNDYYYLIGELVAYVYKK